MRANAGNREKGSEASPSDGEGVKIYHKPNFVIQRDANRKFFCKDKSGRLVAEFTGMAKLTEYVAVQTGKSENYIKQQVYKNLNKDIEFLGYRWSDR